ncbi:hypothetical protein PEX1_003860 [Penicillium expansum]|uniref:BTB domain-containing protein n=1 Tax=Penicillium expansum TaxID=27334 RepID=A0A0A2JR13_PENEN|nr:hypothetical protein PEX2_040330 [Penicillium expansum]KGO45827.1 hypothetical protein PEXP_019500 [Penicillium expansum]KGO57882.1 hypothetical protein PEX2_040330 [Penicillium expansum]KGO66442.1 hypothetical protein PEX1_003860 [Penicillium expansum]
MESAPNFSSIILSPSFTFLVGPQHTKLTIQSGLAQHVSKPLHNLMNGPTRESKHRIAVLEEDDVETFAAFCEYAYTGDYSVPRPEREVQEEHRHGVVEGSPDTATWRGNYRTGSMSSTVPPPAPSPPPQFRHRGQGPYHQPAPEPEMPVPQPVSEPAPAEVKEPVTPTFAPEPEAPIDVAEPEPETETYHEAEAAPEPSAEDAPPADDEWAVPTEEPATWEPEEPKANKKKGKKGKKGKKQAELVEEEPPAPNEPVSLTPPSTPPPEVAAEPAPEPEAEPIEEWATAEAAPEPEPEPTEYRAEPAEESASEPAAAPEEPAAAEEQPSAPEGPMEDSWTQDRSEGTSITQAQRQRPMLDMSFANQQATSPCEPGLDLWDEFKSLQYDEPATSKATPVETPSNELPYITFHAKVYVFATRYLIPALAQLCLRKLHRDLLLLSSTEFETADLDDSQILDGLAATKAQMILELVHYAYTKTARLEPISPTSATQLRENQLRRLVVHYAACNVKELARYHSAEDSVSATPSLRPVDAKAERIETSTSTSPKSLRALLDLTTELASDLVYRMM